MVKQILDCLKVYGNFHVYFSNLDKKMALIIASRRSPVASKNGAFKNLEIEDLSKPVIKVAIEDARKAVGMFDRLSVPIFGIIENMSGDIFGRGGARDAAEELGIEFLGELPLDSSIRKGSDEGIPIVVADPDSTIASSFVGLAEQVASRCSVLQFAGEEARL